MLLTRRSGVRRLLFSLTAIVSIVVSSGCDNGSSTTAPTAPTFSYVVTGDTSSPVDNSYWLGPTTSTDVANAGGVEIRAHFSAGFHRFRGTILYDASVITPSVYTVGTFL